MHASLPTSLSLPPSLSLSPSLPPLQTLINYYLANAAKLRQTVEAMGYKVRQ